MTFIEFLTIMIGICGLFAACNVVANKKPQWVDKQSHILNALERISNATEKILVKLV